MAAIVISLFSNQQKLHNTQFRTKRNNGELELTTQYAIIEL